MVTAAFVIVAAAMYREKNNAERLCGFVAIFIKTETSLVGVGLSKLSLPHNIRMCRVISQQGIPQLIPPGIEPGPTASRNGGAFIRFSNACFIIPFAAATSG